MELMNSLEGGAAPHTFSDFLASGSFGEALMYQNPIEESDIDSSEEEERKVASPTPKSKLYPSYYQQLGSLPPLTRAEEQEAFKTYLTIKKKLKRLQSRKKPERDIAVAQKELIDARNFIVERNLRFVVKVAKSFWKDRNPENLENLVSAGNIGLIVAVDKFELDRGTRFLSYAAHWIALGIRDELACVGIIKVPVWWRKALKKMNNAHEELSRTKKDITPAELAKKADVALRVVKKVSGKNPHVTELQLSSCQNYSIPLFESEVIDNQYNTAEADCITKESRKYIDQMLEEVKPKEAQIIRLMFGFTDLGPLNLRQVANIQTFTSERVRQIKEKGVRALKKKMQTRGIHSCGDVL